MIVGHLATGLLVQALSASRLGPKSIPSWVTVFGSSFNDMLVGLFILLGIERIKPNSSFTPLGMEFTFADYSHSWSMIVVWSIVWAYFCQYLVKRNKTLTVNSMDVWFYAFLSVLAHVAADWLVHLPDMALYPHSKVRLGSKLWAYSPVGGWALELAIILLSIAAVYYYYGNAMQLPGLLLISMHLMNYPGAKTNIPFMLGNLLSGNALRYAAGIAFIVTYLFPGLFVCNKLDNSTDIRRRPSIKSQ